VVQVKEVLVEKIMSVDKGQQEYNYCNNT